MYSTFFSEMFGDIEVLRNLELVLDKLKNLKG